MVINNAIKAINEGDRLLQETLKKANNRKEVGEIIYDQQKVKFDLHKDAMDEIIPYLEEGP